MARNFAGGTDVVNLGAQASLTLMNNIVSWSAWFYATSSVSFGGIIGNYSSGGQNVFTVFPNLSYFWTGGNATGSGSYSNNTWNHVAVTWDGTLANNSDQIRGYLNGTLDASNNSASNTSGARVFRIGFSDGGGAAFQGYIADVAGWNVILSVAEIVALSKGARPHTIRPKSLTAYLPLDGLQSPEPDLSGNKLNGTVTGTAKAPGPPVMMFTPRWPHFWIPSPPIPLTLMPQIVM